MKNLFIKHYIKLDIIHDNLYKKQYNSVQLFFIQKKFSSLSAICFTD